MEVCHAWPLKMGADHVEVPSTCNCGQQGNRIPDNSLSLNQLISGVQYQSTLLVPMQGPDMASRRIIVVLAQGACGYADFCFLCTGALSWISCFNLCVEVLTRPIHEYISDVRMDFAKSHARSPTRARPGSCPTPSQFAASKVFTTSCTTTPPTLHHMSCSPSYMTPSTPYKGELSMYTCFVFPQRALPKPPSIGSASRAISSPTPLAMRGSAEPYACRTRCYRTMRRPRALAADRRDARTLRAWCKWGRKEGEMKLKSMVLV